MRSRGSRLAASALVVLVVGGALAHAAGWLAPATEAAVPAPLQLAQAEGAGARYQGDYQDGLPHGRGVMTWPNGDRYDGDFVEGKRMGKGVYVWGPESEWAGHRYEGDFVAGQRTGQGVYTWPNGDRYEGDFKEGQRSGRGVWIGAARRSCRTATATKASIRTADCRAVASSLPRTASVTRAVSSTTSATVKALGQAPTAAPMSAPSTRVTLMAAGATPGRKEPPSRANSSRATRTAWVTAAARMGRQHAASTTAASSCAGSNSRVEGDADTRSVRVPGEVVRSLGDFRWEMG